MGEQVLRDGAEVEIGHPELLPDAIEEAFNGRRRVFKMEIIVLDEVEDRVTLLHLPEDRCRDDFWTKLWAQPLQPIFLNKDGKNSRMLKQSIHMKIPITLFYLIWACSRPAEITSFSPLRASLGGGISPRHP
jgi:hypothetical protein